MLRSSSALLALALLFGPASAHDRRAQAWSGAAGHIWGSCGTHWTDKEGSDLDNVTSCLFVDSSTCSDRLSDGPADADAEVVLGNLPPSTRGQDVYVAWWGSFKSSRTYDPLSSPHGASVYGDMGVAYPKYWQAGFNGGNVRVDENGTAVIRFSQPSAYFIKPYIGLPHVHFRVCKGEASPQIYYDSLVVGIGELWVNTKSQDDPITVLSATALPRGNPVGYEIPETDNWLVVFSRPDEKDPPLEQTSTTTALVTTTSTTADAVQVVMDAAKDALILDALEFSPVYQCLLEETVFDHFSGACAEECPDYSELSHGQCVLPAKESPEVVLMASWQLEVRCETLCGESMENETLHNLRLSVAGHLGIPFQEVKQVALTWLETARRRLAGQTKTAYLSVKVATKRHEEVSGMHSLTAFLDSIGEASQLLGMEVDDVTTLPPDAVIANGPTWLITSDSDPYAVAYEAFGFDDAKKSTDQSTESGGWLTPALIAGLVGGAVAVGLCAGALLWALRQRAYRKQGDDAAVVEGKVVECNEAADGDLDVKPAPETVGASNDKVAV